MPSAAETGWRRPPASYAVESGSRCSLGAGEGRHPATKSAGIDEFRPRLRKCSDSRLIAAVCGFDRVTRLIRELAAVPFDMLDSVLQRSVELEPNRVEEQLGGVAFALALVYGRVRPFPLLTRGEPGGQGTGVGGRRVLDRLLSVAELAHRVGELRLEPVYLVVEPVQRAPLTTCRPTRAERALLVGQLGGGDLRVDVQARQRTDLQPFTGNVEGRVRRRGVDRAHIAVTRRRLPAHGVSSPRAGRGHRSSSPGSTRSGCRSVGPSRRAEAGRRGSFAEPSKRRRSTRARPRRHAAALWGVRQRWSSFRLVVRLRPSGFCPTVLATTVGLLAWSLHDVRDAEALVAGIANRGAPDFS